jgi:N-acetylglucosamine-6-sulfatase
VAVAVCVTVALAGALALAKGKQAADRAEPQRPNVLIVMTDDQAVNSFSRRYMPNAFDLFRDGGTVFTRGTAVPPLCCPARAGLLTGQYPHNHGVYRNQPGFANLIDPADTLPVWLRRSGYRTGFVGKFMNGYAAKRQLRPAAGFDRWFGMEESEYFNYRVSDDGRPVTYGDEPQEHSTTVATREAAEFITEPASREPFFLWLSYTAPHDRWADAGPCSDGYYPQPASGSSYDRWAAEPLPRGAAFDERDVRDKPIFVRELPRFDRAARRDIRQRWRCTLATVSEVDRDLGRLVTLLRELGELEDTIVVFMSDNGALFGEHRFTRGKARTYVPARRVPFAIRVPAALRGEEPAPPSAPELVGNIDLAPTLLDYAGEERCAPGCRRMDGRSLRGLLAGRDPDWPTDRALLLELRLSCFPVDAIETSRYLLSDRAPGERAKCPTSRELYDLRADPDELRSRRPAAAGKGSEGFSALQSRLDSLRECSGIRGRDDQGPRPFCE